MFAFTTISNKYEFLELAARRVDNVAAHLLLFIWQKPHKNVSRFACVCNALLTMPWMTIAGVCFYLLVCQSFLSFDFTHWYAMRIVFCMCWFARIVLDSACDLKSHCSFPVDSPGIAVWLQCALHTDQLWNWNSLLFNTIIYSRQLPRPMGAHTQRSRCTGVETKTVVHFWCGRNCSRLFVCYALDAVCDLRIITYVELLPRAVDNGMYVAGTYQYVWYLMWNMHFLIPFLLFCGCSVSWLSFIAIVVTVFHLVPFVWLEVCTNQPFELYRHRWAYSMFVCYPLPCRNVQCTHCEWQRIIATA